jgi:hypothetical protein
MGGETGGPNETHEEQLFAAPELLPKPPPFAWIDHLASEVKALFF